MYRRVLLCAVVLGVALAASDCGHRLVAQGDEKTVKVYQSEEIYEAAGEINKALKGQMTPEQMKFVQMLEGMVQSGELRECEAGTHVKIVSTSAAGARVEVLDGPNKGYAGFVPKENVR
jgi:hypothetical protein